MKYCMLLVLIAILNTSAIAVAAEDKPAFSEARLTKMQKQLQLSDEQITEMRKIQEDGGSRKEVKAVLTDKQRKQLKGVTNSKEDREKCKKKNGKKKPIPNNTA